MSRKWKNGVVSLTINKEDSSTALLLTEGSSTANPIPISYIEAATTFCTVIAQISPSGNTKDTQSFCRISQFLMLRKSALL
jgi:hypothetical protein